MRLHLVAKISQKDGSFRNYHSYDVGVRALNDKFGQLSEFVPEFDNNPRFLEDWIKWIGKTNISIVEYGNFSNQREIIDELIR